MDDIKLELYRRECRNLDITPVGAYLRSPSSPILAIKHYSLGPRGAKALSVPLLVSVVGSILFLNFFICADCSPSVKDSLLVFVFSPSSCFFPSVVVFLVANDIIKSNACISLCNLFIMPCQYASW